MDFNFFYRCEDAAQNDIMDDKEINIKNFYMEFGTAQVRFI